MKKAFGIFFLVLFACLFLVQSPHVALAKDKVIVLKYNTWDPPGIGIGKIAQQAADMVKERTNGRVKIDCYFAQSLLKYPEVFRGVSTGIADISNYVVSARDDVNRIFGMAFTDLPDQEKSTKIFQKMLETYPEFNQEFEKNGVRWISIRAMAANQFHSVKKIVRKPGDLKGMRVSAPPYLSPVFKTVKSATLQIQPQDWYSSFERGVAQGFFTHWPLVYEFKLMELFKYHTIFGQGSGGATPIGYVVNVKKFESLPKDVQAIIIDVYRWATEESVKWDISVVEKGIAASRQANQEIVTLSQAEIQTWIDWVKPANEKILQELEAKGWPATKIWQGYQQMIKEMR